MGHATRTSHPRSLPPPRRGCASTGFVTISRRSRADTRLTATFSNAWRVHEAATALSRCVPRAHDRRHAAGEQPGELVLRIPTARPRRVERLDAHRSDLSLLPLHHGNRARALLRAAD